MAPLSSSYNDFLFPKSMLLRVAVTEVRKGWVGWTNYIWIIASCFPVPYTQCRWYVWLPTQQGQICHQRDRKSWREAYNLHGCVSHWPWHPSSKSSLFGKRGRQLAWALPRLIGLWFSWALELAGLRLKGEIRHLLRTNSKCALPLNHSGFVNYLISHKQGLPGGILLGDAHSGDKIDTLNVFTRDICFLWLVVTIKSKCIWNLQSLAEQEYNQGWKVEKVTGLK